MSARRTPPTTPASSDATRRSGTTPVKQTAARSKAAAKQAAAQRALAAERGRQRRQWLIVGGAVALVIAIVAVLVGIKVASGPSKPASGAQAGAASAQVTAAVTGVPAAVLDAIGPGDMKVAPSPLTGAALTADGTPRVLYVGAEWCPYCAAERWSLAVALSRFGTLSGLGETASSPTDVYPDTATLSFHGASYTSQYLNLTANEIESNQVTGNGHAPLDPLDPADTALFQNVGRGAFPFVDLGGRYKISGASYDPSVLQGMTQAEIATALSNPDSPVARAVDGTANVITAALCRVTGNQPGTVCTSPGVTAAAETLSSGG